MQKITTFMMFNGQAKEAAELYTSVFKNSRINDVIDMGESPDGPLISVSFSLDGQEFTAFDGGPYFSFSEGMSLLVRCKTQAEIDHFWEQLSEGGEKQACGWVKDRFGVSWQIVPEQLDTMLRDKDPAKVKRALDAVLQMSKLDVEAIERAHAGK